MQHRFEACGAVRLLNVANGNSSSCEFEYEFLVAGFELKLKIEIGNTGYWQHSPAALRQRHLDRKEPE
jgi:hypothetical protein